VLVRAPSVLVQVAGVMSGTLGSGTVGSGAGSGGAVARFRIWAIWM
jgi:hypothetical protein